MKTQKLLISASVALGSLLCMTTTAKAANFTTNYTPNNPDPKADIWLQSITQNGQTFGNFSLVESAILRSSQVRLGPASTDRGDNASSPYAPNETPTNQQIAAFLGNRNLNNIIDTEDDDSFNLDIFFDRNIRADNTGLDNLFFWERGKNSDLRIQALDGAGNLIGNALTLFRANQGNGGYSIDTTEIGGSQAVGTWGVTLGQLGVTELKGLKLTSNASFSGPDFKVVARTTPEPGVILGLGTVATLAFFSRRGKKAALNSAN
ncbi:MAG: PEP-CTERM sorting domain-containing protein [Nostocales cyanobacterium]|nr:MAG: PEP-CTERM sorting domain-containing protein [Nostocales cyanobacterium]TAF17660.1 MAG: PEP-CTERM sorting domain-containing protein [Nostocales cyanobacterium]